MHEEPVFSESEVTQAPELEGKMYTEVYSHVSQQLEAEEEYSTVREVIERRHPSPLRKSPSPSLPSSLAENEYNITSHLVRSKKSPPPSPQPPPTTLEEEEYSVLDRPGKSVRAFSPPPPGRGNEYSELDIPPDDGEPVVVHPSVQQEGYGKLEFSSSPVEPAEWNEDSYDVIRHDRPRKGPAAKSAELTPVESSNWSPKAKARRVSLKIKEGKVKLASSRDRSILPAYQDDAASPPPKPKRLSANSDSDTPVPGYEPPVTPVDDTTLEEAGYETFNTFSPPPNSEAPPAPWEQEEAMRAESPVQVQLSPKIEIDIDQLLLAHVNSSPFRKAAPVDGLYGKVIDVEPQKVGSDTEYENEASVAFLNQEDHDIGPTLVVVDRSVASNKLQPGDLKTVQCFGTMDTLGYCEIDVDPPEPKPRRKPSTSADEDTKEASQGGSSDQEQKLLGYVTTLGYCEIDVDPPEPKPRRKPSTSADEDTKEASQGGSSDQEQKLLSYVAMDVIQARKEQYKNEKASEEGEEKPRKSLAPPRRRPPPPPPVSAPMAVSSPPHPYSLDEIKTHLPRPASKRGDSPKFEKSSIFSRVKSRSIHGVKPSLKSPTEDYNMEKSFEKSGAVSQSPGLGKKLKGLFKLSSSGDAVPEGKQGASKWKKGKERTFTPDLGGSRKTMTLPAGNRRKHSYDAVDDHGAFSMVSDPSPEGVSDTY